MKKIVFALLFISMFAMNGWSGPKGDIKFVFNGYKQAVLAQDGKAAMNFVTQDTIGQFGLFLDWALHADRDYVNKLSPVSKLQVLIFRHRIPAETLKTMDGAALFQYAVNQGWIGRESVQAAELGDIQIDGKWARGVVLVNGSETPATFSFIKENDKWKFNLLETIEIAEPVLKDQIAQSGMNADDYFLALVAQVSGKKPDATVWSPVDPSVKPKFALGHSIIGTWEYLNPNNCTETCIYRDDGTSTIKSNQVTAEERYDFYLQPGPTGRQKFVAETVKQSKGKDCSGSKANFVGQQYTIYLKFSEDGKEYFIYSNQHSEKNLGPFKKKS